MADLIENRLSPSGQEPAVLSNREEGRASYKLGRRAIVVGAGIGGLSAAGALAKFFDQVDVLERDDLATSARSRSGTPQDRHPHGLLAGALRALDEIFPGFKSDLAAAGAVSVTFARDVQFERPDVGALPKRDFGIALLCATRPLIELVLRRRAEAVANITLRPASRVIGIVPAAGGAGVRGVQFVNGAGRFETLDAGHVRQASVDSGLELRGHQKAAAPVELMTAVIAVAAAIDGMADCAATGTPLSSPAPSAHRCAAAGLDSGAPAERWHSCLRRCSGSLEAG